MPKFLPFWECENILRFLLVCLWLYFLRLDFNPSGIYFCVCCEVGIILYFFPKWITSWWNTIYWIIHLFPTDLKYHLYHILNPHIFLGLFLGSTLFLDLFVCYCAGTAPLELPQLWYGLFSGRASLSCFIHLLFHSSFLSWIQHSKLWSLSPPTTVGVEHSLLKLF